MKRMQDNRASEKKRDTIARGRKGWEGGSTARTERETSPLRKLCAHSKDRFKVYGRRIIPFIVLVNPWIYTPRYSSPTHLYSPSPFSFSPLSPHAPPPTTHVQGNPGQCFNPFPFYERLLRARLAGPLAPICRFRKRAGCLPAASRIQCSKNQTYKIIERNLWEV